MQCKNIVSSNYQRQSMKTSSWDRMLSKRWEKSKNIMLRTVRIWKRILEAFEWSLQIMQHSPELSSDNFWFDYTFGVQKKYLSNRHQNFFWSYETFDFFPHEMRRPICIKYSVQRSLNYGKIYWEVYEHFLSPSWKSTCPP